jgi:hypothetical protein
MHLIGAGGEILESHVYTPGTVFLFFLSAVGAKAGIAVDAAWHKSATQCIGQSPDVPEFVKTAMPTTYCGGVYRRADLLDLADAMDSCTVDYHSTDVAWHMDKQAAHLRAAWANEAVQYVGFQGTSLGYNNFSGEQAHTTCPTCHHEEYTGQDPFNLFTALKNKRVFMVTRPHEESTDSE